MDQERVRLPYSFFHIISQTLRQAQQEREMKEAEQEAERANRAAQELDAQIQADAMRQLIAKEQQYKPRKRVNESTEVPFIWDRDIPTEVFGQEMELDGVRFNAV